MLLRRAHSIRCCLFAYLFFGSTTYSISKNTARLSSVVTAIIIASPALLFPREWKIISLPLFGAGFFLGKTIFNRFTPISRIESAEYELSEIAAFSLARRQWADNDKRAVLDTIANIYVENRWPLVSAFDDLVSCRQRLSWACDWAKQAAREDRIFVERANLVIRRANIFFNNIAVALQIIKSSPKYSDELNQFEEDRRHQEEIRVRWEEAQAQAANAKAREVAAVIQKQTQQVAVQIEEEKSRQEEMRIKHQERLAQQKIVEAQQLAAIAQQQAQQTVAQQKITEANMKVQLEQLQAQQKIAEAQIINAKIREEAALAQKQRLRDAAHQAALQKIEEEKRLLEEKMRIKFQQQQMLAQQKIAEVKVISAKVPEKVAVAQQQAHRETAQQVAGQKQEPQKETTPEPCYKSESCCVCLEDFGKINESKVERIILRKCGHDICKNCAQQLFFGTTKAKTCPTCRGKVDLNRLRADLEKRH